MEMVKVGGYVVPADSELSFMLEAFRRIGADLSVDTYVMTKGWHVYVSLVLGVFGMGLTFDGEGMLTHTDLDACPE